MKGKIIILSAPSGCGKSTIINAIIGDKLLDMQFSVSATSRPPRGEERDGVDYHYFTADQFRRAIDRGEFVEWEEVYPGRYYGTLRSEIERITAAGHNVIMDIDVKGGVNVKKLMADNAISIFIEPPSVEVLEQRLRSRATDSDEQIAQRISKAEFEIGFAPQFDHVVINDDLATAINSVKALIASFIVNGKP